MIKLWQIVLLTLFQNLKSREQHLNISLFVLSYLSLFCKVGHDNNSWLLSRCDFLWSQGCLTFRYLQRQICLFCKNSCNAFMWSECWTNMFSIACFISFDERRSVSGISSNHFSKWERSKLLQFSFSRLASNYNCTKNIPKLSWTFVLTKFSNEGNIWFIAKIHKNHRLAPLSYGGWYRRGKIL